MEEESGGDKQEAISEELDCPLPQDVYFVSHSASQIFHAFFIKNH
jgi:hypothetical protein